MKLKLFFIVFALGVRCMKKGFLLSKKEREQAGKRKENIKEKESFECHICFERRYISFSSPCGHTMCGVCAIKVSGYSLDQNLNGDCTLCRLPLPCIDEYDVSFHNLRDLELDEYAPASLVSIKKKEKLWLLKKVVSRGLDMKSYPMVYLAVAFNNFGAIKFLVENGADPNEGDWYRNRNMTPMMFATARGNLEVVKILHENGANINQATNEGFAAIMIAVCGGKYGIVQYFVEHGANINQVVKDGETLTDVAIQNRKLSESHSELANYLVSLRKEKNGDKKGTQIKRERKIRLREEKHQEKNRKKKKRIKRKEKNSVKYPSGKFFCILLLISSLLVFFLAFNS